MVFDFIIGRKYNTTIAAYIAAIVVFVE